MKTNFVLFMEYDRAWYESKWPEEISSKLKSLKKQYKVDEKWVSNSYIEVFLSVSSLENSTNRGSDILFDKKSQTYHTKLPALSPFEVIQNKNSDWIKELHRVIWLDKNAVKWYRFTSLIQFSSRILSHGYPITVYNKTPYSIM